MVKEKIGEQPKIERKTAIISEKKIETVETASERVLASFPKEQEKITSPEKIVARGIAVSPAAHNFQKRRELAIDNILAEGLSEIFLKMKPEEQKEFKKRGEETAAKINLLLNQAKVKVNKIIKLIKSWLSAISGINRFFLEQDTKIKADKIIKIKDKF